MRPDLRRRRLLLGTGFACLLPSGVRAQAKQRIVDAAGRAVDVPGRVARVYAAGPPASILLFALAPERLLGWTTPFRPAERAFVPQRYAELPVTGRLTGRGNTANIEVVLAAKPDLIIDYGSVNRTYASLADRVQQQTGIPYLLLDGAFDRMAEAFATLGSVLGEKDRAADWARYVTTVLADVAQRIGRIPGTGRPRVYYARGPQGLDTGLGGSINMEIIERMGAINVAAELGKGGLARVSMEQVLAWNPDHIVTTDAIFFENVRRDPAWQALHAVGEGRVHLAPAVPFGWIDFPPSVNRLVGLHWLGRILYPKAFPEDLRPFVRDFYARAYHQTPSDAQLDALLAPSERPR